MVARAMRERSDCSPSTTHPAVHTLTAREADVLTEVLAGQSRDRIAVKLSISPYAVQEHLESIFAKTGTSSCRGLIAYLVGTQYFPRIGSAIGPDGWFAAP
ncbi:helix-turn-helix transcriptional regulator [Rhodococcus chondri]|uniref:Helix-turn-helix transcriptional regulator n=1 Tax=Rhodococcus chondri TaxID=3065941 RepID=A0ABU7JPN7_9NOCA|nr:helix-turn-helix transcriptional regulator [Rhodococcus sp. CC-R104]MEE2031985.1 helix-turn-helix transcriptional regulator [Rhodococcus sp. CC-R104]